jgi:Uma2 family endonuclease
MSETIASTRIVTWDEFVRLPDDDRRELIDGVLQEVEVPGLVHEHIVMTLGHRLKGWTDAHGGLVLASGYKVRISPTRGLMPDIQVYRQGSAAERLERGLETGHPDLAVEILSPGSQRHDRVVKLHWYAELGVPEYWLIDPPARTLEQFLLEATGYRLAQSLRDDAVFQPASFPGLEVRLGELWSATAR